MDKLEQKWMNYYRNCGADLLNIKEAGSHGKHSEETKAKMSLSNMGKHNRKYGAMSIERRMRKSVAQRMWYSQLENCLRITLNMETGIFYLNVREAAEAFNIKEKTLNAMLRGQNRNRTNLKYV
jgi:hypothetical protein